MNAVRYIVSGRVQGVGFRWFVMREAARLDLAGYVRNLPDGTVEVVAQGAVAALVSLESGLRHGPPAARVDSVDKSNLSHQIDLPKPFDVM
ncbi:MAG TPA: acylphosphatase [Gaiellales bacterium]|nr:acylphosphatase [Gaiellales bacterium]